MVVIILNTLAMATRYFMMPQSLSDALDSVNLIFAGIFNIEMILKMCGLGCFYFR